MADQRSSPASNPCNVAGSFRPVPAYLRLHPNHPMNTLSFQRPRPPMLMAAIGSLLAAALYMLAAGPASAAPHQPNIVFILTDDLGWGDVGTFFQNHRGDRPRELTPHLDRMAAQGVMLTQNYVAAPVCVSSRSSLLTGLHQGNAVVRDNQFDRALEDNHTLATVLRQAGYATAAIGKWGLQGGGEAPDWDASPLKRGFGFYFGYVRHVDGHEHYPKEAPYFEKKARQHGPVRVWDNRADVTASMDKCYTTDLFTARAKKWIIDHTHSRCGQPFFMYLAYDTPHAVIELPTQAYPGGAGFKGGIQWLGEPGHMINTASGKIDSWYDPAFASATHRDGGDSAASSKPWPDVYRRYATCVRRIDYCVNDLLQLLKDLGIDDNTLVIFSSDNGPSMESYLPEPFSPQFFSGYGPFDGIKRDCWEGGLRVPTIVRWPKHVAAGRVIDRPCASWDWLPTFAGAAGVPAPARADGVSLLPLLTGHGSQRDRGYLYFEYHLKGRTPNFPEFEPGHRNRQRNQMQAIRLGNLMGVRYDIKSADDDFEIYNVQTDPKEARNLARDSAQASVQRKMKTLALQAHRPSPEAPRPYDAELVPAVEGAETTQPGVNWAAYQGEFPWVPDFEALTPMLSGRAERPDFAALPKQLTGAIFSGYLIIPADGEYAFYFHIDGRALLRLHDALMIDADYGYAPGAERTAKIRLAAGLHPFRLFCTTQHARTALSLDWSGPGFDRQPVAASAFAVPPR